MQMQLLTKKQVRQLYHRMKKDFPRNELKPLGMILRAIDNKQYECYGFVDEADILGYAFFVRCDNDYLFDYLAIDERRRNQNLGTQFLSLIHEHFREASSVIGEVEDPDTAVSEENRQLRTRRLNFYLRNGVINTGVKAQAFGVDFQLLEMKLGQAHSRDEIGELYKKHYRCMLPEKIFAKYIHVNV